MAWENGEVICVGFGNAEEKEGKRRKGLRGWKAQIEKKKKGMKDRG